MRKHIISYRLAILVAAALAAPALADNPSPVYLLFANTSTHAFHVKAMTLGGKTCADCSERTIAPGTTTLVKIGALGSRHLKFTVTGNGSCLFDIGSSGASRTGDCGSSPKLSHQEIAPEGFFSENDGTPTFELIFAYDPVQGK